ncbi:MAG TPA: hypothetical protein VG722_12485 [Tepidisphaeraceae bacterium]|nr:hypothetical protein [Tepidisphaeraceae bacterium]
MSRWPIIFSPPESFEMWVWLIYGAGMLLLAKVLETLARVHFQKANRLAEAGFTYEHENDRYRCPEGTHLHRHSIDRHSRLAVYRAPAATCNCCRSKHKCTPHDQGRHIYRSLALWSETDLCRFHQYLSGTMLATGMLLSMTIAICWRYRHGAGLLAAVALVDAVCLAVEVRRIRQSRTTLLAMEHEGENAEPPNPKTALADTMPTAPYAVEQTEAANLDPTPVSYGLSDDNFGLDVGGSHESSVKASL